MKLSIVTINRNNAAGLEKTMRSVVSQTFKEFEYIIIDGASTDEKLGKDIVEMEQTTQWGNKLIDMLSIDLRNEFPNIKGFSRRNLYAIRQWYLFFLPNLSLCHKLWHNVGSSTAYCQQDKRGKNGCRICKCLTY